MMDVFTSRDFYKVFTKEDGRLNYNSKWAFEEECFQEWKQTLRVGQEVEVVRPNHTRTNNSAAYFNCGLLPIIDIKEDEVVFQKGKRKLHYTSSDFTYETSDFVRKKAKERFGNK